MESGAPRREGLLKLKFGTVCTSTLFARITVRLIELSVLWAHAAHTGTDFSFTRKVSKSVSKRRCPLGYLLVCHETLSDKKGERDRTAGGDGFS